MAAISDLVSFYRFNPIFFLITTMFQMGINKKITFNKHFARKYIRAYTMCITHLMCALKGFDARLKWFVSRI